MKSAERQAAPMDHKTREFPVRQQTRIVNAVRAHLGEFGIVVPKGIHDVDRLLVAAEGVPEAARPALDLLAAQLRDTRARIAEATGRIEAAQAEDPPARRLATIPGIGVLTASAPAAATPEVGAFRSGRDCAAWLGPTPKPHSTGGKERPGRISKAGNRYLRRLPHLGASRRRRACGAAAQIGARRGRAPGADWLSGMLPGKRGKVAAVALANRMARVVWALIRSGGSHRPDPA